MAKRSFTKSKKEDVGDFLVGWCSAPRCVADAANNDQEGHKAYECLNRGPHQAHATQPLVEAM